MITGSAPRVENKNQIQRPELVVRNNMNDNNSVKVLNLPPDSKRVDLTILIAKTHLLSFLQNYWVDSNNIGHLVVKRPSHLEFVLFILRKYIRQECQDCQYYFEPEEVIQPPSNSRAFTEPSFSSFPTRNIVSVVIIVI